MERGLRKLRATIATGLVALPLLLAAGCSESAFDSAAAESALAQDEENLAKPVANGDEETSAPLADCAKPGAKKVLVCHVPAGNPIAKHTICVSPEGAAHGHGLNLADVYALGAHGGDKLGACDDELPDGSSSCPEGGC